MTTTTLARLLPIDPRTVWANEASHFTPWLAEEENLALLGDTIGLDLELEAIEQNVGPYRADILCKDTASDTWVLIENQLERTDHGHLGQLLTYAAGLDAVTIVWIARRFTDEHRAALDWLNDITGENVNFFGLEVELWRIADSPIAPKLNMASKPNDWIKTITASRSSSSSDLTETKRWQLNWWTHFNNYLQEHSAIIKARKPHPQHWMDYAVGRTDFSLQCVIHAQKQHIRVSLSLWGPDAKPHFHLLRQDRGQIEAEISSADIEWSELPNKQSSYISTHLNSTDPTDRNDWPRQHHWLLNELETFHNCFAPRVKALNASDYVPENDHET